MNRQEIEIAGVEYRFTFLPGVVLVYYPDGSTEFVDDIEHWVKQQQTATDGGRPRDGRSVCDLCGEPYDSYMTHLSHCQPE